MCHGDVTLWKVIGMLIGVEIFIKMTEVWEFFCYNFFSRVKGWGEGMQVCVTIRVTMTNLI
jgi:hypothetical protein